MIALWKSEKWARFPVEMFGSDKLKGKDLGRPDTKEGAAGGGGGRIT